MIYSARTKRVNAVVQGVIENAAVGKAHQHHLRALREARVLVVRVPDIGTRQISLLRAEEYRTR